MRFALQTKTDIADLDPKTGFGQALVVYPEGVNPKKMDIILYPHGGPHSAFHSGFLPQVVRIEVCLELFYSLFRCTSAL